MAPDKETRILEDTDFRPGDGTVVRVKILAVPESEKFEDGVKYRLHYGTEAGDTIVRYDNSHGVHERHTADGVDETYEFPGYEAIQDRFWREVNDPNSPEEA